MFAAPHPSFLVHAGAVLAAGRQRSAATALVVAAALCLALPIPAARADEAAARGAQPDAGLDLPDLKQINRPAIGPQPKADTRVVRRPSFELHERDGTEVREYRDRGKPVEIDVRSGFGTSYRMSPPPTSTPAIRDGEITRVPAVQIGF